MDNSKDWGEFLEGIKAAQQAAEAQKEANEQHEKYERLRFEFTLALINNNDPSKFGLLNLLREYTLTIVSSM